MNERWGLRDKGRHLCGSLDTGVNVNKLEIIGIGKFIDLDSLPVSAGKLWVWVVHWRVVDEVLQGNLRQRRLSLRTRRWRETS
jgi:hypothetical protein